VRRPLADEGEIPRSLLSRCTASSSCCSERKTGCGSPQPPYRNIGVPICLRQSGLARCFVRHTSTPRPQGAQSTDRGTMSNTSGLAVGHSQSSRILWPWLEGMRAKVRPWRQLPVRGAVVVSSAVPVIREAQRANMPYGDSGVDSSASRPTPDARALRQPRLHLSTAAWMRAAWSGTLPGWDTSEDPHNFLKTHSV
jgi:hypothetical protein